MLCNNELWAFIHSSCLCANCFKLWNENKKKQEKHENCCNKNKREQKIILIAYLFTEGSWDYGKTWLIFHGLIFWSQFMRMLSLTKKKNKNKNKKREKHIHLFKLNIKFSFYIL